MASNGSATSMSFFFVVMRLVLTGLLLCRLENGFLSIGYAENYVGIAFSLRLIAFCTDRKPTGPLGGTLHFNPSIALEFTDQRLYLVAAEAGEHLLEFIESGAGLAGVFDVSH
jgi:hypothetical protein